MNIRGRRFETDKANGKIAGVCAGLGETLGVDPNVVKPACPRLDTPAFPLIVNCGNSRPWEVPASYMYCGRPSWRMS